MGYTYVKKGIQVMKKLILGVDISPEKDVAVIVVGEKEADGKTVLSNMFTGKEATDLYETLMTRKDGKD